MNKGAQNPLIVAMTAVLGRLKQVNRLWHQAEVAYFDPPAFRVALQNCITTARTVTFILQSHKSAIPGFDEWYKTYTDRFALDPVMRWAVNARNKIEKQGDLETRSQVRAELVAAYAHNPSTLWLPAINATPEQIRLSIPAKFLDEHAINTGILAIERRWVDAQLPEHEILDALAYVYGQLALLVVALHDHLGWSIPQQRPDLGEHLIANLLPDGRLKSMERPSAHPRSGELSPDRRCRWLSSCWCRARAELQEGCMQSPLSLHGPKSHLPPSPMQALSTKRRSDSAYRRLGSAP